MRVIAGTRRSLPLKTLPGEATRPTSDKIKETLFNVISPYIPGGRFLDLFSGSGQIGIEALSRGAEGAVFVENNPKCISITNDNIAFTKFTGEAKVIHADALSPSLYSRTLKKEGPFDIIFMDPPYAMEKEEEILGAISSGGVLEEDGLVIIEASARRDLTFIDDTDFEIYKIKKYKTNQHIFLKTKTGK